MNIGKIDFKWNVWVWDVNSDSLKLYDVVPLFLEELKRLKKNAPKTHDEFAKFLENEARYHFWSRCEYEMIVHSWPCHKNEKKVDVYDQLEMNWDVFVDSFWNKISSEVKRRNVSK